MKLKPCPFCGGRAEIVMVNDAGNYQVACTKCSGNVGRMWFWKKQQAANAWNSRVGDDLMERMEDDGK